MNLNLSAPATVKNLFHFTIFPNMFLFRVRKSICRNCAIPFLDVEGLHSWSTLKENVCILLYISSKKSSFQWSCKTLSCGEGGWMAGGWIIFFKADRSLDFVKCYTIFHFNWNFWKFNYFLHFSNFNLLPPLFYSLNFTKKL